MSYKIVKLNQDNRQYLSNKIKTIEKDIYYPLGEDSFKIDHGDDYFKFFERLGELHYWCVFDGKKLVGVAAGILRTLGNVKSWYLCDLKVIKEYRGKGIPQLIFKKAFLYNLLNHRIFRAYAVSMNNKDKKLPYHKIKRATLNLLKVHNKLNIYTLSKEQSMHFNRKHKLFYTNTKGCKELILKSSNERLKLFHLTSSQENITTDIVDNESTIMLSAFEDSKRDLEIKEMNGEYNSDATVLSFRLKNITDIFTDEI